MLEKNAFNQKITKQAYKSELPGVREALLNAQFDLLEAEDFSVVLLIAGIDGDGKAQAVNDLNAILDTHYVNTVALGSATKEDRKRPPMRRFWRLLPKVGHTAIFLGSWYSDPIRLRVTGRTNDKALCKSLNAINRFERLLFNERTLILKFWIHLTEKQQKKRRKMLKRQGESQAKRIERFLHQCRNYPKVLSTANRVLDVTSTEYAPWIVIGGTDHRYRRLKIAKSLLHSLRRQPDRKEPSKSASAPLAQGRVKTGNLIAKLDLSRSLKRTHYKEQLKNLQSRLHAFSQHRSFSKSAVVVVFEGNDAAGKGGAIRRVTEALDADMYRVYQISAPNQEERSRPYLWRFWRAVPRFGQIAIFDRSWYGRVLVERIEGFCSESDWMRAYDEINDFEAGLVDHGIVVLKFWLAISSDEQLARFKAREQTGYKRHKITEEDWRNRGKWDLYEQAACDMFDRTDTKAAPWTLVEANDKNFARIKVLETLCHRFEQRPRGGKQVFADKRFSI